jgi:hypothetical protein
LPAGIHHGGFSPELITPPARKQVDNEHDERDDQQYVYQAAGDMKAEAQKPKDQDDYKDRPQHAPLQAMTGVPGSAQA